MMADLEVKLQSIEENIKEVKRVIEAYTSPHNRRKSKSHGSQPKWLRTITDLILHISTDFQNVKAEFRQRFDDGSGAVRVHGLDARESVVESQTQTSETSPETGQQPDHNMSTTPDTDSNSPTLVLLLFSIGCVTAIQSTTEHVKILRFGRSPISFWTPLVSTGASRMI